MSRPLQAEVDEAIASVTRMIKDGCASPAERVLVAEVIPLRQERDAAWNRVHDLRDELETILKAFQTFKGHNT